MLKTILLFFFPVNILIGAQVFDFNTQTSVPQFEGPATNGLQPVVSISDGTGSLFVNIDLVARTNFPRNRWLKILDKSGSYLNLWSTNGTELLASNVKVIDATTPNVTYVSNILSQVARSRRGMQWWPVSSHETPNGECVILSGFVLQSLLDVALTNDVVLEIRPLIYKVDTNQVTARLVEFQPFKLLLTTKGEARQLK